MFFLLGGNAATWAGRIPAVKAGLHLSAGTLGLALLGPALGAVVAMPVTGAALASVAPRRIVQTGFLVVAVLLPVTTMARSSFGLFAVRAGWGIGNGMIDVGMNTEAAVVQDRLGRGVMSRFHGTYSIGALMGAGRGAVAATLDVSARLNFTVAAAIVAAGGAYAARAFRDQPASHANREPARRARRPQWS